MRVYKWSVIGYLEIWRGICKPVFSQAMEKTSSDKDTKKTISSKGESVNEPGLVWQKETNSKKLIISTVHDQEQDNYLYWLRLTPEQRIASVTLLIQEIFAEELNKPRSKRIIFD
jgi:hypothetical protein